MGKEQELLKPCPFCGGAMQHRFALWPSEGDRDAIIHAAPTDCPIEGAFSIDTFDNGVSVAEVWNRRSSSDEAEVVAWRCTECGCQTHARVDERKPDGSFGPGPEVRCVSCKAVSVWPSPSGVKAGVTEALKQARKFIADDFGDASDAHEILAVIDAALALPTPPIQGDAK